ncbi:MAG: SMI1/KNR4 family protein [Planctomycetaceae bacterium]|jgi:hypothetical protein|nr:SMI1/KNR4 family protein [Planctomycetaceae bacterium]
MSLSELLQLAPPPMNPIYTGSEEDFLQIENQIGSKLPDDYKKYIQYYGDCMWYRHICISTPFDPVDNGDYSLWGWHKKNIEHLSLLFKEEYSWHKYPVFPEKGGIFLCGGDIFGEMIAWITEGEPDNWSVVYFNIDCCIFNKYDMNITTFLLKLVKNEIHPDCFTDDLREIHKNRIVSVTSVFP